MEGSSSQPYSPQVQSVIKEIMENGTYTVKSRRSKNLLPLLICLGFTVIGIFLGRGGDIIGWFSVCFFGLGVIVFGIQMISHSNYLLLTQEGFTMRSLFRSHSYKWTDVRGFGGGSFFSNKAVVLSFSDSYKSSSTAEKIGRKMVKVLYRGDIGILPDTYSVDPEELAELLNMVREHFLSGLTDR